MKQIHLNNTHFRVDTIEEYQKKVARTRKKEPKEFSHIAVNYGYREANRAMELDNPKHLQQEQTDEKA